MQGPFDRCRSIIFPSSIMSITSPPRSVLLCIYAFRCCFSDFFTAERFSSWSLWSISANGLSSDLISCKATAELCQYLTSLNKKKRSRGWLREGLLQEAAKSKQARNRAQHKCSQLFRIFHIFAVVHRRTLSCFGPRLKSDSKDSGFFYFMDSPVQDHRENYVFRHRCSEV